MTIIIAFVLSFIVSYLFYRLNKKFSQKINILIHTFRGLSLFFICYMLLSPLIEKYQFIEEKPIVAILQDFSASIEKFAPKNFSIKAWDNDLKKLSQALKQENLQVVLYSFSNQISPFDSLKFKGKSTNIKKALEQIYFQYSDQNLGAIVLCSDGIINSGGNPLWSINEYNFPIYSVGMGNTNALSDISIINTRYNSVVFLKNDFIAEIEIKSIKSKGAFKLQVKYEGKVIITQTVLVEDDYDIKKIQLAIPTTKKGFQEYEISVQSNIQEVTKENNTKKITVEVLNQKSKILLWASSPHPDIAAIKNTLEQFLQYEVSIEIKGLKQNFRDFDVIILYQLPNIGFQAEMQKTLQKIVDSNKPLMWVIGKHTHFDAFNKLQKTITLPLQNGSFQESLVALNKQFFKFNLANIKPDQIASFPALWVPFGKVKSPAAVSHLLFQKIGSIVTSNPVFSFSNDGSKKQVFLMGEGYWKWKIYDFQTHHEHDLSAKIFHKAIQFLSAKEKRDRLRVMLGKKVFWEHENIFFNAELYDETNLPTQLAEMALEISDENANVFPMTFDRNEHGYFINAGAFPSGLYQFKVSASLDDSIHVQKGTFKILPKNIESLDPIANHNMLKKLSESTQGMFVLQENIDTLALIIKDNQSLKPILKEKILSTYTIQWKWLLVLILFCLSIEWFLRKNYGEV